MKTIGLLGGTDWPSTIRYYQKMNEGIQHHCGDHHSAKLLLKSIDHHDMVTHYGIDDSIVETLLTQELEHLVSLKPHALIICSNTLHYYFDRIRNSVNLSLPIFHAIDLLIEGLLKTQRKNIFLLATKFTLDHGFFEHRLTQAGISVATPTPPERDIIRSINQRLSKNILRDEDRLFFQTLIYQHRLRDAVVLGCTEFGLIINEKTSALPIEEPLDYQIKAALSFALRKL